QRGPAITTWATPSGVRLLIAYHTKPVNEQVEIHVAYTDDNGATPWVDQLLETVGVTDHVANGKILQLPRPDLVRRADLSTQQVVVAYPAFDAATGTNDVVTQLSSDGGVKWTKKSLPLPAATRHDRFFPTLATTEPLGRNVLLAYYDTREDPAPVGSRLGVWASVLDPSSNQWTQPFPVASGPNVPFTPCIIRGDFYGHYFAVAGASDNAPGLPATSFWPHWADSRNFQRTEVWSARIVP
ncbi:MAG: exo-alpha-sialidase, partial [Gemmatimonadetes bacterium]|nr:exo-alpha-sialidase [Gemmatimonadota bacterium]